MRVLSIGADRSKRGVLFLGTPASARQRAYAETFGRMDIVGFSREEDGVQELREGALSVYPTNSSSRWRYMRDAFLIAKALPRPDAVTAQDPFEAGLTALRVARRFRVPLHIQVHTDFLSPQYAKGLMSRVRKLIAGYVLRRATRIRVVSERIKDSLVREYGLTAPITVLPIYADIARIRQAGPDAEYAAKTAAFTHRLLVVARLEKEKNVALAVTALASAPKETCLIVVGDGKERARLEALAARLGISDRVFFAGERDATAFYSLADLVLVTSRYEGYGLVIIEALARGVPVLSTDVGIARETGAIVTSPERFVDALAQWLKDGPREAALKSYPYANFDDYVRAYCDDIAACKRG